MQSAYVETALTITKLNSTQRPSTTRNRESGSLAPVVNSADELSFPDSWPCCHDTTHAELRGSVEHVCPPGTLCYRRQLRWAWTFGQPGSAWKEPRRAMAMAKTFHGGTLAALSLLVRGAMVWMVLRHCTPSRAATDGHEA